MDRPLRKKEVDGEKKMCLGKTKLYLGYPSLALTPSLRRQFFLRGTIPTPRSHALARTKKMFAPPKDKSCLRHCFTQLQIMACHESSTSATSKSVPAIRLKSNFSIIRSLNLVQPRKTIRRSWQTSTLSSKQTIMFFKL